MSEAKQGRYELIQVTCAEILLSHFEVIWWYFFSHLSLFYRWNILKIWEKPVKVEHGCRPLSFASVLHSQHEDYAHHVSYMCTPSASDVGDVRSAFIQFHICEAMRWLSHTWSEWDVFWEVHCITWLFSQKVWEFELQHTYFYFVFNVCVCSNMLFFYIMCIYDVSQWTYILQWICK